MKRTVQLIWKINGKRGVDRHADMACKHVVSAKGRFPSVKGKDEMIELGKKVKDTISGFTGIAIGRCKYLTGCEYICIQPEVKKDGLLPERNWFDEPLVEEIKATKPKKKQRLQVVGGPMLHMPPGRGGPR